MDVFGKVKAFRRVSDLKASGLYPYCPTFLGRHRSPSMRLCPQGREVVMFGSNDYLGLTTHPRVNEAAILALEKYGSGCSGSRLLNGTLDLHQELESSLASFLRKEAALVLPSGFQANLAAICGVLRSDEIAVCDHEAHASIVEGVSSSRARLLRFRHSDCRHFAEILKRSGRSTGILAITEGIFSMSGDIPDLAQFVETCKTSQVSCLVDEAHGVGVLGCTGAGASEEAGVLSAVDIVTGTFSKSLASTGGFVASTQEIIEYIRHTARAFVFSAALPPASAAAALAALNIVASEPHRRQAIRENASYLRRALRSRGFRISESVSATPIVGLHLRNDVAVCRAFQELLNRGLYVNPVLRPGATQNMLRISVTAEHSSSEIDFLVQSLALIRELDSQIQQAA